MMLFVWQVTINESKVAVVLTHAMRHLFGAEEA
jgi:hypothetical protein